MKINNLHLLLTFLFILLVVFGCRPEEDEEIDILTLPDRDDNSTVPESCSSSGCYVAIGLGNQAVFSNDGENWAFSNEFEGNLRSVVFRGDRFIAVGSDGLVMYTLNGKDWIKIGNVHSESLFKVIYAEDKFVAVGSYGAAVYSNDGVTWIQSDHGNGTMSGLAYGNGQFVAVGSITVGTGAVSISDDGISWTDVTTDISSMDSGVAFGNGLFVAVDWATDYASYSDNGTSWTEYIFNPTNRIKEFVVYGENIFVIGGDGIIEYSVDGVNWSDSTRVYWPQCLTFSNSKFTGLTQYEDTITSVDGINWQTVEAFDVFDPNYGYNFVCYDMTYGSF